MCCSRAMRMLLRGALGMLTGLLFAASTYPSAPATSVVINEFLAANVKNLDDENGDFEDWFELYNPTATAISLKGYTLTDKPTDPKKWVMPDVVLQPKAFLLIWASGKDRRVPGTWNFLRPLRLELESKGYADGDDARILVNAEDKSLKGRGINVVRLDARGHHVESTAFDTYESPKGSESMIRYLTNLPAGEILIFAVKDDAAYQLTTPARIALRNLGSEKIGQLAYQDSWGMVAIVGQGKLVEAYTAKGKGPATASLTSTSVLHTNFKLNKEAEYLGLFAPDGRGVDAVNFAKHVPDVSYGRQPDGGERWCFFAKPTPNSPNDKDCAPQILDQPDASKSSGLYAEPLQVALATKQPGAQIYYTLDGSTPTKESLRYTAPLAINKTQILRARAVADAAIPSQVLTRSYFVREKVHLPVLSLVTDPANLWDPQRGIYVEGPFPNFPNYVQRGREWERPVSVEFFEPGGSGGFAVNAGLRIHGGDSRVYPKKSFRLYFRDEYGPDHLKYPLFTERLFDKRKLTAFERLVIRNAGDDGEAGLSRIRDALLHALWAEEGGLISAKRSVFVFLNGVPWGIYDIRERIDRYYLESNYGAADPDLLWGFDIVEEGDDAHWLSTFAFFEMQNLALDQNYEQAQKLIDVRNFTDYQLFHLYGANIDYGPDNIVAFRPRQPDGKWQWILWDADYAFALSPGNPASHNTLEWLTRDRDRPELGQTYDLWTTLFLRQLLTNTKYRTYFINRCADLLNTTLHPSNVLEKINELASIIRPDIPREMARWSPEWAGSVEEWEVDVEKIREFAKTRPAYLRAHVIDKFGLPGLASLTLELPSGSGSVRVNTVKPASYPWQGVYFRGVPVTLQAEPGPGYKFAGWSDDSLPQSPTVSILLPESYNVRAVFVPAS